MLKKLCRLNVILTDSDKEIYKAVYTFASSIKFILLFGDEFL